VSQSSASNESALPPPVETKALPDFNTVSLRGFFIAATFTTVFLISAAWVWAIYGRMWFLDPEYAMWLAKGQMVNSCDVGETTILGDSRAMAGLIPAKISDTTVNLAAGGASPIETKHMVKDILKCPNLPKRVILPFLPLYMTEEQVYWERTALFNYLTYDEMEEVRETVLRLDDHLVYSTNRFDSYLEKIKNLSYSLSFPTYYFPAMVHAGFVGRKQRNEIELQKTLQGRGHHFFGMADETEWLAPEALMENFAPRPVLVNYYDRVLKMLRERGIKVYFVGAPLNEPSRKHLKPEVVEQFTKFIRDREARDPNFRALGDLLPSLPAKYFGDEEHLNAKGAAIWSASVAEMLEKAIAEEGQGQASLRR
jgi:hypothetical protein